jgi:hypothetical protein
MGREIASAKAQRKPSGVTLAQSGEMDFPGNNGTGSILSGVHTSHGT